MMATSTARRRAAAVAIVGLLGIVPDVGAELRRVEAVGLYGIEDEMRSRVIARDEAIARARWEGVSRVALELIGEADPPLDEPGALDPAVEDNRGIPTREPPIEAPLESEEPALADEVEVDPDDVRLDHIAPSEDQAALLLAALGKDMLPYTRSYRILEDQGELPVLFADQPGIETEYVVVIEVIVDVDRVTDALVEAGLVFLAEAIGEAEKITLELVGLARYEALETVVAALRGPLGATRVRTLEFGRGRQLLGVEGPFDLEGLAQHLANFEDPQLVLEPISVDPVFGRIRVLARWFPAPEDEEGGESAVSEQPPG